MPVLRDYKMRDGSIRHVIDPAYEHEYRKMMCETSRNLPWSIDPTYNLRRSKR